MQFVTAIAAMIGAYVGTALTHQNEEAQDLLIAATSGGFVYIATIGVLADVMARNKQPSLKEIVLETFFFLLGVGLMVAVALTEVHAE